jgi:hypothetical protein
LAERSAGRDWDWTHPLPNFFLSKVGPTPILQNASYDL